MNWISTHVLLGGITLQRWRNKGLAPLRSKVVRRRMSSKGGRGPEWVGWELGGGAGTGGVPWNCCVPGARAWYPASSHHGPPVRWPRPRASVQVWFALGSAGETTRFWNQPSGLILGIACGWAVIMSIIPVLNDSQMAGAYVGVMFLLIYFFL